MRGRDALHLVHPRVAQVTRESPRVRRLPAASLIGAAVGMLLAARRGQGTGFPPQNKRDEDLKPVA